MKLRSNVSLESFNLKARQRISDLNMEARIEMRTLQEHVSGSTMNKRLTLQLIVCFAVLGILVSGLGVYATSTLMASSRTIEIGVRVAMGAQSIDILLLILLRSARVLLIGLPWGLFFGWALAKGLSSVLFQVQPYDPVVWLFSCVLLTVIVFIAALIPALRAICANPLDTLRNE